MLIGVANLLAAKGSDIETWVYVAVLVVSVIGGLIQKMRKPPEQPGGQRPQSPPAPAPRREAGPPSETSTLPPRPADTRLELPDRFQGEIEKVTGRWDPPPSFPRPTRPAGPPRRPATPTPRPPAPRPDLDLVRLPERNVPHTARPAATLPPPPQTPAMPRESKTRTRPVPAPPASPVAGVAPRLRQMLNDPNDLRAAFVLSELLGPPLGLRDE